MKKSLILSVLIWIGFAGMAQAPMTPDQAYQKVEKVLEKDLENHRKDLENQYEAARLEFEKTHEDSLEDIEDKSSTIRFYFWLFTGFTVAGWAGTCWWAINYAKGKVKEMVESKVEKDYPNQVEKEISKLLKTGSHSLRELIRKESFEYEIKQEMPLLVVCENEKERGKAELLVKQVLGFKLAKFVLLGDFHGNPDPNLVVLFDLTGNMVNQNQSRLEHLLGEAKQKADQTIYVLLYPGHWPAWNGYRSIGNAANSEYTLYSRIMESLIYLYLNKLRQKGLRA